jgi:hypothetical protein
MVVFYYEVEHTRNEAVSIKGPPSTVNSTCLSTLLNHLQRNIIVKNEKIKDTVEFAELNRYFHIGSYCIGSYP